MSENPQAFPTTQPLDSWSDPNQGMSLRDYFAGQALVGWLASWPRGERVVGPETVAAASYQIADAMLVFRMEEKK